MSPSEAQIHAAESHLGLEGQSNPASVLRHAEIEEASNRYVVHRISLALIPLFIRLRITPNAVSCMGALCGLLAAWSYYHYENPWACLLGFALMVGWHIFDGADGQLARQTGQVSAAGFIIDGACDYLTFIFVYTALGLSLSGTYGAVIWVLIAVAALSHVDQAAAFEMQRETYIAWTSNQFSEKVIENARRDGRSGLTQTVTTLYGAVQAPFRPLSSMVTNDLLNKAKKKPSSDIPSLYRDAFKDTVRAWSILSANNRTIAILIFCLSGMPLWYFVYECVVLNLALVGLVILNRRSRSKAVQAAA